MLKGVAASSIVLSTALALTGCMAKQGDLGNKNIRSNNYRAQSLDGTRFANDGANETNRINGTQRMNNNIVGRHGNSNLALSQDIADRLAALPEIKSAYVALTNNNAYVAIVEDRNATRKGTTGTNGSVSPLSTGTATGRGGDGSTNPNHFRSHYSADGIHFYHKDQIADVPRTGMHTRSKDYYRGLSVGNEAANNGFNPNGTATGTGTGTFDRNAAGFTGTAGVTGTAAGDVSDALKNKVADIVKGMHPTVDNVYVSANADFYSRMQNFAADVGSGHPIRGLVNEFNALVNRIFPENAATGTTGGMTNKIAPNYTTPAAPARSNGFANR